MNNFLLYLLEASGVFMTLYMAYRLFLSNLTFHSLNRLLLLSFLPLSLLLPLLHFGNALSIPVSAHEFPMFIEDWSDFPLSSDIPIAESSTQWNLSKVLSISYGLGLGAYILKMARNIMALKSLAKDAKIKNEGQYQVIRAQVPLVFSYFRWIFIPTEMKCDSRIIEHEKLHGKAGHTYDLLATELFSALLWFNPFVILFRKSLKSVHEYQVDARLLQTDVKASDYLGLILNSLNKNTPRVGLYNYFNSITLKKRIEMITKHNSSKRQLVRYLLVVPVITLFLMSFTLATDTIENTNSTEEVKMKTSLNEVPSIYPINKDNCRIASRYGMRIHPISKEKKLHSGIDFSAKMDTPILATADGQITVAKLEDRLGNHVIIHHGIYDTFYGHMNRFIVTEGQSVKRGDVIGYVGNTGMATGSHLHYEVRKDGKTVNPIDFMPK